jgi:hypothetical protein
MNPLHDPGLRLLALQVTSLNPDHALCGSDVASRLLAADRLLGEVAALLRETASDLDPATALRCLLSLGDLRLREGEPLAILRWLYASRFSGLPSSANRRSMVGP